MTYYKCGSVYTTQNSNVVVDTASGSVANFETDLALPIKSLEIDVNAKQDLHGYDYPWTAGGGKNILKTSGLSLVPPSNTAFSNATKRTFSPNSFCLGLTSNNYFQNNKVTQYLVEENNISVTSSANAYAVIIPITNLNIGETYTLSASSSQGKISVGFWEEDGTFISNTQEVTSGVLSFTVPQNTFYVGLSFNPRTNDVQATFTNIQLEKGSTATDYAPYANICPIEGWSEVSVIHCGKNLCHVVQPSPGAYWGTNFDSLVTALNKLPVGTYTLSNIFKITEVPSPGTDKKTSVQHGPIKIYAGSISVNSVSQTRDMNATKNKTYTEQTTFEITEDIKGNITRALLYCDKYNTHTGSSGRGKYSVYNIMVELGLTKTAYSPTSGRYGTEVINLGGTYYGGHFTQDKDGHREFEVTHKSLDWSALNFRRSNNSGNWTNYLFFASVPDMKYVYTQISDIYGIQLQGNVGDIDNYKFRTSFSGSIPYVYFRNDDYTDVETFTTAMLNHQLVYELATPYTIDLPDGEPIKSLPGVNNIFCDTGDTSLQFRKIG